MNINGECVNFAQMNNPTLYTSAYLVSGVQGYTKHYYAGSERVSSAIGLGGLENINDPLSIEFGGSWDEKSGSLMEEMNRTIVECLKNDYNIATSLHFLHGMTSPTAGTMDRYFYHPDHLGSSSWITDGSGNAIQHLHYLPFGEDWVDQRNASWNAPYTFSGKEKDVETGYSYFGARYYDSGLSIWLSVDPMSDKYPSLTPYNYCANNPVKYIDFTGEEFGDPLKIMQVRRNSTSNTFGPVRKNPDNSVRNHQGVDYHAPIGTPAYAVKNGVVVKTVSEKDGGEYGAQIIIQHYDANGSPIVDEEGNFEYSFYAHLSEINVKKGDAVVENETVIGKTGNSGNAKNLKNKEDEHLHFEIRKDINLGKGLKGRKDPNEIVDTKFKIDSSNPKKVIMINETDNTNKTE